MSHDVALGSLLLVDGLGASDCEALNSDALLVQPINTITSLAYVVAGLIVAISGHRSATRAQSYVFGACLTAIGLGSVAFHGPQPTGARIMHDLPILVTFVFMLVRDANLISRRVRPVLVWFVGGAGVATALSLIDLDAALAALALVVVGLIGCEFLIWHRGLRSSAARSPARLATLAAAAVVAALAWLGGRTDSPLCDPSATLQLHGLWHVLSAVAIFGWWWLALRTDDRHTPRLPSPPMPFDENYHAPERLETSDFVLRPILVSDAELDYEAVMESREFLRLWEQSTWPEDDFTVDANREDMALLERRRHDRESFTYTVMNLAETECLGCVYIFPSDSPLYTRCSISSIDDDSSAGDWSDFDAVVSFWVRKSRLADGLDRRLLVALGEWFTNGWPIERHLFLTSELYEEQVAMFERAGLQRRFRLDDPKHDADDLAFAFA